METIVTKSEIIFTDVPRVRLTYNGLVQTKNRVKITQVWETERVFRRLFNGDLEHIESMWMLAINRANEILGAFEVSRGGVAGTVCDPKVVFQFALLTNASGIILAHNHPSGNLTPSQADIDLTKKVKKGAALLEMKLLDHLIITAEHYYSFASEGQI